MATFNEYLKKMDAEDNFSKLQKDWLKTAYQAGLTHGKQLAKPKPKACTKDAEACIAYYNEKANKNLGNTPSNLSWPLKRLTEGYTVDQLCQVVDYTVSEWNNGKMFGDTLAAKFIRPQTIWQSSAKVDLHLADWAFILENKPADVEPKIKQEMNLEPDQY
jgi:uncharacterized phage protein (TIGR02220 family)